VNWISPISVIQRFAEPPEPDHPPACPTKKLERKISPEQFREWLTEIQVSSHNVMFLSYLAVNIHPLTFFGTS
jgi:hypothetical protein